MDKPPTHNNTRNNDDYSKFQSFNFKHLSKKSFFSSQFCITSVFALFVVLILSYNSFTIFYYIPVFSIETEHETEQNLATSSHFSSSSSSETRFSMNHGDFPSFSKRTHFISSPQNFTHQTSRKTKQVQKLSTSLEEPQMKTFSKRVRKFFNENSCKFRVFMTWISSIDSFGDRERFTIESLFKFHPNACLLIVSTSMDSNRGSEILKPFWGLNFKVMAVSPDFKFIFKNTMADYWYNQLQRGKVRKGEISLGQNLSNLIRLALLYKYGGVYMDTDFIVLKRFDDLRNSIGAQAIDQKTKNWVRLNNALMIFDKKHPLLIKFIEEFALTFDGNKWGHNGPYLVSRVVERVVNSNNGRGNRDVGDFTILPPAAFYAVGWGRIGDLFRKPIDETHLKWMNEKVNQIEERGYAIHLWNRQSKEIRVEDGSIISQLMKRSCVFCNLSIANS